MASSPNRSAPCTIARVLPNAAAHVVRPVEAIGTVAVEGATLFGGLMQTVTPAETKVFDRPARVRCEPIDDHPSWLESFRGLRALGPDQTEMTCRLSFDVAPDGFRGKACAALLKALCQPRSPGCLHAVKARLEAA